MAEIKKLFKIPSLPGVRRDGTTLDSDFFNEAQWCRWQRGRPKKMGGFARMTNQLRGPIRSTMVWSRESLNAVYAFSAYGIEMMLVDYNGTGSSIIDRTPASFTTQPHAVWSVATQYDDAVGTTGTVVLAHASDSLVNIDSTATSKPLLGLADGNGAFTEITDAPAVSGGIFSVPPYTCAYSSDGFYAWSDANQPTIWYTSSGNIGDAGADRITGAKIVKGLPLRSGSGPAALIWSLDSVIRKDWLGSTQTFRFTHLSTQSSILSQSGVIEYDGMYFWIGVDRFLMSDGSSVKELPNQMNINWFFDNLNFAQRQKVWAMKIPRFGEIWWFFPYGEADECTNAVIFNVREGAWYDTESARSSGFYSQVFRFPVMSESTPAARAQILNLSSITGTFTAGDSVIGANGAQGILTNVTEQLQDLTLTGVTGTFSADDYVYDSVISAGALQAQVVSFNSGTGAMVVRLTLGTAISTGTLTNATTTGSATISVAGTPYYPAAVALRVQNLTSTQFEAGGLTDSTSSATATIDSLEDLYSIFTHERGHDKIDGDIVEPIPSHFVTSDFGFPTGGPQPNQPEGLNRWTRLVRIEPDFLQDGEMTVEVLGKEFANAPETVSLPYNFDNTTERIDMREQRREIRLKFSSNTVGGNYEMGHPILHLEPGDVRS
jgi:hypothetical protein